MIGVDNSFSGAGLLRSKIRIKTPSFASYIPNIKEINKTAKKYSKKKNIIVIGNGGSVNSFDYYINALKTKKNVFIVKTMEPDFLCDVKNKCSKKDTVIIAISKSGNTVGVIESLLYFINYKDIIIITEKNDSALKKIQETYNFDFLEHPNIGGRYSGFTSSGLLPAAISGINIEKLWKGAKKAYNKYSAKKPNDAIKLASTLYKLDRKGYSEIFMPIYSSRIMGSGIIITQLLHESVGKKQRGQTLLASFAPESQHHTNQRFFGGKKNMVGCFIVVDKNKKSKEKIKVPKKIQNLILRDGKIVDLGKNTYSDALKAEFTGTLKDARRRKIPNIVIRLEKLDEETVGEYLAFWHYVTVYLCILNGVNPFNQPEVDYSKKISFELRRNYFRGGK
jgi:glucose-6-phosphate isomerase